MSSHVDLKEVQCPFDKSHSIIVSRLAFHLTKCSANVTNRKFVACQFNNQHVIPEEEAEYHREVCPDRKKLDLFVNKIGDIECPVKGELPIHVPLPDMSGEDWDDDNSKDSPLVDIASNIQKKEAIRIFPAMGQSKSIRKQLKTDERNRMLAFENDKKLKPKHPQAQTGGRHDQPSPHSTPRESTERAEVSDKNANKDVSVPYTEFIGGDMLKNPIRAPRNLSMSSQISLSLQLGQGMSQQSEGAGNIRPLIEEEDAASGVSGTTTASTNSMRYNQLSNYRGGYSVSTTDGFDSNCDDDYSPDYNSLTDSPGKSPTFSEKDEQEFGNSLSDRFEDEMSIRRSGHDRASTSSTTNVSSSSPEKEKIVCEKKETERPKLELDEHGFLKIPIPGKGRGRGRTLDTL